MTHLNTMLPRDDVMDAAHISTNKAAARYLFMSGDKLKAIYAQASPVIQVSYKKCASTTGAERGQVCEFPR